MCKWRQLEFHLTTCLLFKHRPKDCIASIKTRTKKKTLNPQWDETFYFRVRTSQCRLVLDVFDENRVTRDDFLGRIILPVANIPFDNDQPLKLVFGELQGRSEKSNVKGEGVREKKKSNLANCCNCGCQDTCDIMSAFWVTPRWKQRQLKLRRHPTTACPTPFVLLKEEVFQPVNSFTTWNVSRQTLLLWRD